VKERWRSKEELSELIRRRRNTSKGRAQALFWLACASGEVRHEPDSDPVLLLADDGIVGMDMRPGAQSKMGVSRRTDYLSGRWSEDDLIDWLDRQPPEPKKATPNRRVRHPPAPEEHRYRNPDDAPLVRAARKRVAKGMSKLAAATLFAPKAVGGTLEQRVERLRKLI
jgi:hypothetical protein